MTMQRAGQVQELFSPLLDDIEPSPHRQILRHRIADRDALDASMAAGGVSRTFQPLERGRGLLLNLEGVVIPGLAIWNLRSDSGFESMPMDAPDVFVIRIPITGHITVGSSSREHSLGQGDGSILRATNRCSTRLWPGSQVFSCAVGVQDLVSRHEVLEGSNAPPLQLQPLIVLDGSRPQALAHTIRQIGHHLETEAASLMGPLLVDLLMNQILSAWPQSIRDRAQASSKALSRAIDHIEAHLAEPMTLREVASAAGVSLRTLQIAFRNHIGRTPLGYILDRRLECAHADLLANDGQVLVKQVAHRWGFLHLSEFARRYRARYGRTPSQAKRCASQSTS